MIVYVYYKMLQIKFGNQKHLHLILFNQKIVQLYFTVQLVTTRGGETF